MSNETKKKFRVTYDEVRTARVVVDVDAKDEEHARALIERVPSDMRPPHIYEMQSVSGTRIVDNIVDVVEVKS